MTSSHYALSQNHYKQDLQGHEERQRRQFHFLDQALNFDFPFCRFDSIKISIFNA